MAKKPQQKHQPTRSAMDGEHAKTPSATKSGPGRFHKDGYRTKRKGEGQRNAAGSKLARKAVKGTLTHCGLR